MALDARRGDILWLVVGRAMKLALSGVAVGLAAAFALTRLMQSLLFEVKATDPVVFASIAALLVMVAFLVCYLPAWRAARIEPMTALRDK